MEEIPELYFERDVDWYDWLLINEHNCDKVFLIFYKLETGMPTMRWEEAVKVALCFGWIDSTVKSLGGGKRRQYFCKRKPKSPWSQLNKKYIIELEEAGLIQESGYNAIEIAKENGAWCEMDDVENLVIPKDLKKAFNNNPQAFDNYQNLAPSYRKAHLHWLHNAKREETRQKRIIKIIEALKANKKHPNF